MKVKSATDWTLLIFGALWLGLVGCCTVNLVVTGEGYSFWIFGVYLTALGLIPFFAGLKRVAGAGIAGGTMTALASLGLVLALWQTVRNVMDTVHRGSTAGQVVASALFSLTLVVGPVLACLLWGVAALKASKRGTKP